jgi:hypothetical protein
MEKQETINAAIAKIIRERSASGQLVQFEEIMAELTGQGLLESEADDQKSLCLTMISRVVEENGDLRKISGTNEISHYYSSQSLSEAYAGILVRKEGNRLEFIAQIVRENSSIYPRPVPLDIFVESPFDLTRKEVLDCLGKMAEQQEYQDIAQTTTSIGTIFLYSNRCLEPAYGSLLAEWLDVGQANNP